MSGEQQPTVRAAATEWRVKPGDVARAMSQWRKFAETNDLRSDDPDRYVFIASWLNQLAEKQS